jgi:hypothetical protein
LYGLDGKRLGLLLGHFGGQKYVCRSSPKESSIPLTAVWVTFRIGNLPVDVVLPGHLQDGREQDHILPVFDKDAGQAL